MSDSLDPAQLERHDTLFIAPHGDDALLACPARLMAEVEKGRRVLVVALFAPVGAHTGSARVAADLGASYVAAGLPSARDATEPTHPMELAALLVETGTRTQAVHVYAPLGLGHSADHALAYEAAARAFATERGRNLFLYEERPEAFVPGAVRTRLALLGARLPAGAARSAEASGLLRHLWHVNEPCVLRGEAPGLGTRLTALSAARRRFRQARPWNPLRAYGPRLQPVLHAADEETMERASAIVRSLLPVDRKGRPRSAEVFAARARAAARRLGAPYHAERLWLFLPSSDGLPEVGHPLEVVDV
jgi:LmbE family N-acetylglucosaminyl deacetylase